MDYKTESSKEYHWAIEINKRILYFKIEEDAQKYIDETIKRSNAVKQIIK